MAGDKPSIRVRKPAERKPVPIKISLPGLLDLREGSSVDSLDSPQARERASEMIRKIALAETVAAAEQFTHEFVQWAGQ
jgi:hypothetical protein